MLIFRKQMASLQTFDIASTSEEQVSNEITDHLHLFVPPNQVVLTKLADSDAWLSLTKTLVKLNVKHFLNSILRYFFNKKDN